MSMHVLSSARAASLISAKYASPDISQPPDTHPPTPGPLRLATEQ